MEKKTITEWFGRNKTKLVAGGLALFGIGATIAFIAKKQREQAALESTDEEVWFKVIDKPTTEVEEVTTESVE